MKTYLWPEGRMVMLNDLFSEEAIHTGEWQSMDTSSSKLHATHELEDVTLVIPHIPRTTFVLATKTKPTIFWADSHFIERVSGYPLNPPPSAEKWPYAVRGNRDHTTLQGMYDHTYPERFWPKHAGSNHQHDTDVSAEVLAETCGGNEGIRFHYGDLEDVVNLLVKKPNTRQAYLPVWFPEDTGAIQGQRVPCTLGYHFMIRDNSLSCRYYMRSCDVYRHLNNDLYLAGRLMQWITREVRYLTMYEQGVTELPPLSQQLRPGKLLMYIASLHAFVGDIEKIKDQYEH